MISHSYGDAAWHRDHRGINTPEEKRIEMLQEDCNEYCKRIEFLEYELAEAEKDAERYRWLRDATGETPLRPAAYSAETCPDMRLRLDFPTIISYDSVGNITTLDQYIDAVIGESK